MFKPYDCIGKKRLLWVETEYTDVTSFVMKQGKHATEGQCWQIILRDLIHPPSRAMSKLCIRISIPCVPRQLPSIIDWTEDNRVQQKPIQIHSEIHHVDVQLAMGNF